MATPQDGLNAVEERRKKKGVPLVNPQGGSYSDEEITADTKTREVKKKNETLGDVFRRNIEKQGGWGFDQEGPATGIESMYMGLQGLQAGMETAAEKTDEFFENSGIADALSIDGNKFLPGSAVMALGEAFPAGGMEAGLLPRPNLPEDEFIPEIAQKWGGRDEVEFARAAEEADINRVLAERRTGSRVAYQEPQLPSSVHPDDEFLTPPKGGLESGRGMDERELARYNKARQREKLANEEPVQAVKAAEADRPLADIPDDELLAMEKDPSVLEEFRRRNREEFGQEPVRGGDLDETVNQQVGGIGPGQGLVPKGLEKELPKQPSRSIEDTLKAADETELTDIGDVSAVAARGAKDTKEAAARLIQSVSEFGPQSDEMLEALTSFVKTADVHSKNSSELGRGLNVLGKDARPEAIRRLRELAEDPGKAEKLARLVNRYKDDPSALTKIARDSIDPSIGDRILSFRYNMMLSGPKTHVYNVVGNTANIAVDVAEHGLASVLGLGRKLTGDLDRVTGKELGSRVMGAIVGARQGLKNMPEAFREGRPLDDANRAEMTRGRVGNLQVPVKAIAAEDEFFRSVAEVSNTYGLAVRKAVDEGLTGDALKNRVDALIRNPSEDMIKDTGDYAKRMRFQDDPSFLGKMIEGARTKQAKDTPLTRMGRFGLNLILPFVRTPDSLIRTAIRRSPLGVLDGQNIADFKAGGARRDLAISRVAMGSGVTALVASKVLDGVITGEGPRDYKKRQALELTGWQSNSVKIGDKYYSYAGLEPLSIVLGGTATMMERSKELSGKGYVEQSANQALNATEVLAKLSWAEGLGDLFNVLDAPEGQKAAMANNFFANIAQSFVVPAAVRQVNQAYFDPMQRDTRGDDSMDDRIVNRIKSGIPGMSDDLPAQVDALGNEIGRGDALGPDILSRAYAPLVEGGPVADELKRLMEADPDGKALLNRVSRSIDTKSFPIGRLTAQEHHDYQQGTGLYFSAMMEEEMAKPEYQTMSDDDKRDLIREVATDARKFAREDIFESKVEEAPKEEKKPEEAPKEKKSEEAESESEEFTFGVPTSGTRSEADNKRVGGVPNSDHLSGDGMDFVPSRGVTFKKLYVEAKRFFGPDAKVIWEKPGYRQGAYHKEHVHVSLPGLNAPEF